ncbi:DUF4190 domain-containing protein [Kineococcus sp. SYSU DK001]|uniref:DUF4190 domain-containing protein n=1 Tax=Kineococcus sp. SYSU DK001 TaxID=3383122 RepID=UPI003D7E9603
MSSEYAPPSGYGDHYGPAPKNGLGVAALVLGIFGLLLSWIFIGVPLAIAGLVMGVVARRRVTRGQATNRGVALAAVIVSAVALVVGVAISIVWFVAGSWFLDNGGQDYADCVSAAGGDQAQVQQCAQEFQRDLSN